MRRAILSACFLVAGFEAAHGQLTTVIDDNFESGLGAWNIRTGQPWPIDVNGTPVIFSANDPLLHQQPGVTHDSQSAGFASNLDPWDQSLGAWMEKRFVNVLPPGTYNVRLEYDVYVYKDPLYRDPTAPDPWAVGARVLLLTDLAYNNPCINFDGGLPPNAIRKSYWPGNADTPEGRSIFSGLWRHIVVDTMTLPDGSTGPLTITTGDGSFELRLLLHEKYKGAQAVAWDNINITIGSFPITETFESGLEGWTVKSFEANHPHDDTPLTFAAADPKLFTNTGNPGSTSAGFNTNLCATDTTRGAWLYQLFPATQTGLSAGTYVVTIDLDAYVYKDPTIMPLGTPDHSEYEQALGNRVFVLTDDSYDNPDFAFDTGSAYPGFALNVWRGDSDGAVNGVWQHLSVYRDVTTTTGNFEIRLLMQDLANVIGPPSGGSLPEPALWSVSPGAQTVAWDNVRVQIGPPCYEPRFDSDGDGDVDQEDFAAFQLCYTGSSDAAIPDFPHCRCMNANGDTHIDDDDLAAFTACVSGPTVPADEHCDDNLSPP